MGKFSLEIETDNDAFCGEDDSKEAEIVRILRRVAEQVAAGVVAGVIFDRNGNRVGSFGGD